MLPSEPAGIMKLLPHLVVMNADHAQNVSIIMQAAAVKKSTLFTGVCAGTILYRIACFLEGRSRDCFSAINRCLVAIEEDNIQILHMQIPHMQAIK